MSKTKFSVKITGLEISFEGDREDLPRLTQSLGAQVDGLINAPLSVLEQAPALPPVSSTAVVDALPVSKPQRTRSRSSKTNGQPATGKKADNGTTLSWNHDVDKWGQPIQSWNPTKKAVWLLYVVKSECDAASMPAGNIAAVFNKYFSQAGNIRGGNVSRDLRKASQARPPQVQKDMSSGEEAWSLTQTGTRAAEELVAECRGIS
jgi:hypothetical protein